MGTDRLPTRRQVAEGYRFPGLRTARLSDLPAEKKPRKRELTAAEKERNRRISQVRVRVEHAIAGVKRSWMVKDVLRNTKDGISDLSMLLACGVHNLRVQQRQRPLRR